MKIKNVVLNLSSEETLRLTRIFLDEDKDEALAFLTALETIVANLCWVPPLIGWLNERRSSS